MQIVLYGYVYVCRYKYRDFSSQIARIHAVKIIEDRNESIKKIKTASGNAIKINNGFNGVTILLFRAFLIGIGSCANFAVRFKEMYNQLNG